MRKAILSSVVAIGAGFSMSASALTVAQWTFETLPPSGGGAGPFFAEGGEQIASATALGHHAGVTTYSAIQGNGSAKAFTANNWAAGDYWQFQLSSVGRYDFHITYDQTGNTASPRDFYLTYSVDGNNFTVFGGTNTVALVSGWNSSTPVGGYTFSYDLSSVTALNNQSTIYFRIVDASSIAIGQPSVAANGTDRIDNVIVTAVPEPQSLFILGGVGLLAWMFTQRRR